MDNDRRWLSAPKSKDLNAEHSLVKHGGCPCEGTIVPPKIKAGSISFVHHRYVLGIILKSPALKDVFWSYHLQLASA